MITCYGFELESPNLHQICILGFSPLVFKVIRPSFRLKKLHSTLLLYTDLGQPRGATRPNVLWLSNYFTRNNSIHEYSTWGMNEIHVPFGRLHIKNFSIRIHGAKVWNSLPSFVKQSRSLELFKNTLRNYLFSSESIVTVTLFWWFDNPICVLKVTHFWWLLPYLIFSENVTVTQFCWLLPYVFFVKVF